MSRRVGQQGTAIFGLAVLLLAAQSAPAGAAEEPPVSARYEALAERVARETAAGRFDAAIGLYEDALKQDPSWLEARWGLATLLYDASRYEGAREQFEAVLRARPDNGAALALKGLCEAMLGQRERAVTDLRRAIELGIGVPRVASAARYQAAVLTNKLGDPDGAFEILRSLAMENEDGPPIIDAFGLILLRLPLEPAEIPSEKREMILLAGRAGYHMARARRSAVGYLAIEELVSRYPAEPNVHFAYGMYLLPDDPGAAIEEFRRELGVSPGHHVAMIQLALAELKRGRVEEALPFAEKAVSLAPDVPAAHLALGRSLLAAGQIERAVEAMETAVKLAPEIPRLRNALAQAYHRAGRREDAARARAEFQKLQGAAGDAAAPPDEGVPSAAAAGNSTD